MNKALKMFRRLALCIVLILNCLAFNAVTAHAVTYTVTAEAPANARVGEIITVNIRVSALKTYGGNLTMSYDNTKLALVSAEKGALAETQDLTLSINGNYADDAVRVSWAKGSNIVASGYVGVCTFRCIEEGSAAFSFTQANIFDASGESSQPTTVDALVTIDKSDTESSTEEPDIETTTQEGTENGVVIAASSPEKCRSTSTVDVDIVMAQDSLAYGGNVVLQYDNTLFSVVDCTWGEEFGENALMSVNTAYAPDKIKLSWADNIEYTESMKIASLQFKATGNEGTAAFAIPYSMLSDGNGNKIATIAQGCETVISDTYTNDDFDVLSIGKTPVKFMNDETSPWTLDTAKVEGETFARSGAIGDDSSTAITADVEGPGTLKFDWAVSSEDYEDAGVFDYITFCIDGEVAASIAGDKQVATVETQIPEGKHTISWVYQKDGDGFAREDCAWFGNVDYSAAEGTLIGDADNNGVVDIRDAIAIIDHVENNAALADPQAADTDGDGEITNKDGANVLKFAAGIIKEFK